MKKILLLFAVSLFVSLGFTIIDRQKEAEAEASEIKADFQSAKAENKAGNSRKDVTSWD